MIDRFLVAYWSVLLVGIGSAAILLILGLTRWLQRRDADRRLDAARRVKPFDDRDRVNPPPREPTS